MLEHYFTVAIRNFRKDKGYSLINLIGLSLAVACSFLFLLWVQYENNYESAHKNRNHIYRVVSVMERDGELRKSVSLPGPLGQALVEEFPSVINSTFLNIHRFPEAYVYNEEPFAAIRAETDKHFFEVFTYEFLQGLPASAFEGERPMIVSEEFAKKMFGNNINDVEIVGQLVYDRTRLWDNQQFRNRPPYIITAVVRIPKNTHIWFDVLVEGEKTSIHSTESYKNWGRSMCTTFIQTDPKANFMDAAKMQMADYMLKHLPEDKRTLTFEPLTNIHLHSQVTFDKNLSGDMGEPRYIRIFLTVAFFVLIIAIINYVNLSIARGANRSREVGVRKVEGAYRRELIVQFVFEAFISSLVAMLFAFALSEIIVKWFSTVIETPLFIAYNIRTFLTALGLAVFVALLSSGYSAFYLTSFRPSIILKGGTSTGSRSRLRKTLLGIQLTLSAFIILCTCIVYKQLHYIQSKDPGFDRFNVIHVSTGLWYSIKDFKQEVLKNAHVEAVSIAWQPPFRSNWSLDLNWDEKAPDTEAKANLFFCDWDYAKVFKLQLLEGDFLPENIPWNYGGDQNGGFNVLNEAAVRLIGKENIVGTQVNGGKMMGIVRDFNFRSFHQSITPLIISYNPETSGEVFIRISPHHQKETLDYIQNLFKKFKKDTPFEYSFVDDEYMAVYRKEFRMGKVFLYFSLLSIFISCMGVFSLVAFMVEHRSKEIGIRKIHGAKMYDIILLFISEFSLLVGVSFIVAAPVAWYLMNRWLMDYYFRINIGVFIFIGVLALIWALCMLTLLIQVYKAARRNPVETLKSE